MAMYTRTEDGGVTRIPAEHEAVIDLYREQLATMLVWEPQGGDFSQYYLLVDDFDSDVSHGVSFL
ncbi:hypothetical protein OH828_27225 [Streptomyces anulatus]|uniref:hypothetical protein n=1 Tax=Streptomyces anulatus TaxID=1892 RepID=UPI00386ED61B